MHSPRPMAAQGSRRPAPGRSLCGPRPLAGRRRRTRCTAPGQALYGRTMTFQHRAVVDAPLEEVFGWHTRPGALARLLPPWQPVSVVQEAHSLRDGRAVLGLPARVKWVAAAPARQIRPPHRFADALVSLPFRPAIRWEHVHEFRAVGDARTEVADSVDTNVPERWLGRTFAYRQRQLAGDLAAHEWGRAYRAGPLRVAMTGSSGLIGTALRAFLTTGGHDVVALVRHPPGHPGERQWRPEAPDLNLLDGVDAVIHLAGASIAGRFTAEHKRRIRSSRIEPTAALARRRRPGRGTAARPGVLCHGLRHRRLRLRPRRRGADRDQSTRRRFPGRRGEGLGSGDGARSGSRAACRPRAHRHRAVSAGRLLAAIAATLRGGTGRPAGLRAAVDLVDRHRRPRRHLPPRRRGPAALRSRERGGARPGPQHRLHRRLGRRPAPAPGHPRSRRSARGCSSGRKAPTELVQASQRVRPERLLAADHPFRYTRLEPALRHLLGRVDSGEVRP